MQFDVVTLFPDMVQAMGGEGVTGRALQRGVAELRLWNPRDFTRDVHRTVDDRPYGGGPGMVMKIAPLKAAIEQAKIASPNARVAYMSPQGRQFDQAAAQQFAQRGSLILVAGRYEGIDERVMSHCIDEEWSIGDYVLSGGELPALVMMDAIIRLLPGTLGTAESAEQDSYVDGLLDCPHFTRPEVFEGEVVPKVLMGGNHELIRRWRLKQSLGRTWERRPDLLRQRSLNPEETTLLNEYIQAQKGAS